MESIAPSITENCRKIITNPNMIIMLRDLSIGLPKNSDGNVTIEEKEFKYRVDKFAELLIKTDKDELLEEMGKILHCVKSNATDFHIEIPLPKSSDTIDLYIKITPTATGGRRSKTRRTKKGKRKGRGRKTRQRK